MSNLAISFEVYPPREGSDGSALETSIRELAGSHPEFISVTFGAGGSSTSNSLAVLEFIKNETHVTPLAHVTCVGNTYSEAKDLIAEFLDHGITDFLALRGDLPQDPIRAARGELKTAAELVQLIQNVAKSNLKEDVRVAVATFPNGHPESDSIDQDIQALISKQQAGAQFAITQLFFFAADYFQFVSSAQAAGVTIPILPGIMPVTSMQRLNRVLELTGERRPTELANQLDTLDRSQALEAGINWTANLAEQLAQGGAPGVHLYAFNQHQTVQEVLRRAGIR